ncbi:MAG: CxxxxCH/CxxCH domain-containing protein, partial [Deltaproteobacteria bacterium]
MLLSACSETQQASAPASGGTPPEPGKTCTSCHGDATRQATAINPQLASAPPKGSRGETETTTRAVGTHQLHLQAIACTECHVVPTSQTHSTGTVEVTFGSLATTGGVTPSWNGTGCAASYCHGNFKGGNPTYVPTWTSPAATTCGTCHALPPAAPHPPGADCSTCHTGYTATSVNPALHMNGAVDKVEVVAKGCTACHGDSTRAATANNPQLPSAPPKDTQGNTATTARGVGAHERHLVAGTLTAGIACGECHVVPTSDTHSNGTVDVAFGALSRTGGVTPVWNGTGCEASYCHGNFKNGKPSYVPGWTAAAPSACGTCHGMPPGGTHPYSVACGSCHPGYTSVTVNLAVHLNGTVDLVNLACTSCHGSSARASVAGADVNQSSAPPVDTQGGTSGVRVGTHLAHVNPSSGAVYKPIACSECHPDNSGNGGHSNGTVNVTFAGATGAKLGGTSASLVQGNGSSVATTCTTYCHGASLDATTTKGSVATWSWNGAVADCGSCHKAPPATANHHNAAAVTTCNRCHSGTVDATGAILVSGGKHVNGAIDTANLTCSTCHGSSTLVASGTQDANVAAAPTGTGAPDTYGNTAVTTSGVGAHAAHVLGTRSKPVLCNACHTVPASNVHKTGSATAGTVVLGNLATKGSITGATYVAAGGSCAATYCHGNLGGGIGSASASPSWKTAGTLVCNSCHGSPPAQTSTGQAHPNNTSCGSCHPGYTSTTVNAATHVNGTVEYAALSCTSCHGDATRTGADADLVAFSAAPPLDTSGASTGVKVGAHLKHLLTGAAGGPTFSKQVACAECHSNAIPATPLHSNGQPNVAFGPLAAQGTGATFAAPSYAGSTCSNTYCHGNFKNGAGANPISWTGTAACGSCHGVPPSGTHPAASLTTCGNCHGNYDNVAAATNPSAAIIDPSLHVDGNLHLKPMSCSSCHGASDRVGVAGADAVVAAAPPSVASPTGIAGAHLAHVNQGSTAPALSSPLACSSCHTVPADGAHSNGVVGVNYAGIAVAQGAVPGAYDLTAHTCSNTYCHGNFPGGNQNPAAISWATAGKLSCTGCHGS